MIPLPRLGMGTSGIGNLYTPITDDAAHATVTAAWQAGIRYFDTAPHYGFGLAERRLGEALAALDPGGSAIVSTKVGRLLTPTTDRARKRHGFVDAAPFEPVFDYRGDAVLRSYEESLVRLRRDRVDILLAHDLGELTHGSQAARHMRAFLDSGYAAMRELKDQQAVGAIGVGVNEIEICLELLERVELDVILLAGRYTLLDQRAGAELFPLCRERGVRIIAGGPYNSGILAQPTASQRDPHYDYAAAPAEVLTRAATLEQLCASHGVELGAAALQFPLRHPAIVSVIPGLVGEAQVRQTVERMAARIPEGLWAQLTEADAGRSNPSAEGDPVKSSKLMLLNPEDNVAVCIAAVAAGEPLQAGWTQVCAAQATAVGHKIARQPIAAGERVRKYGAPIGTATQAIAAGEWVHVHNMKSDYIPTHDRRTVAGAAA